MVIALLGEASASRLEALSKIEEPTRDGVGNGGEGYTLQYMGVRNEAVYVVAESVGCGALLCRFITRNVGPQFVKSFV